MPRSILVFVIALVAAAQQPAPQPATTPPPTPQSRLASFSIVALDAHGKPVTDLRPGDLKVEDNGKPVAITFFKPVGPVPSQLSDAPKAGEYTNTNQPIRNTTVILFDLLNEGIGASASGTNELISSLQHAEAPERIALIILTRDGKFFSVHDFGPGAAAGASSEGQPWTNSIKPILDKAMTDVINHRNGDDRLVTTRVSDTLNDLGKLTFRMGNIPGRKTLIWVSAGVPLEMRIRGEEVNFTPSLQRMAAAMNEANITAYTVRQSAAGAGEAVGTQTAATLSTFAELTGGRSYPSDYVGQALTDSAADARASYRAGFFPPADYWNDKFHKIRVTSTRPDVKIRTVSGIDAIAKPAITADDVTLLTAPGSLPADLSEIGLRAVVSHDASRDAAKGTLHFQLNVKPQDLPFEQAGDKFFTQLSLAFLEYDSDVSHPGPDNTLQPKSITTPLAVKLTLTREQMDRGLQQGVSFTEDVTPAAAIRTVRLVLYSRASNEYGTLTVPVTPP